MRSYEIFVGKRAKSQQVKQKCRNILCCNPDHLYIEENQLDEDKIKMIRDLHRQGVTYEELRKRFKISKSHISNIILNRCWKHV